MIKAASEHPFIIAAARLLIAALFLFPLYLRQRQTYTAPYHWRQLRWSLLPGVILALHFITWNLGVQLTPVANASLIVNMTPAAMPFFLWIFYRERVNRREWGGTLLALSGLALLAVSHHSLSLQFLRGDLICFVSMLLFAAYLALGRRNGARLPLWLYMVPLYFFAGLLCLGTASLFVNPIHAYSFKNALLLVGLALIPTIGGHTILNYSMKFFRGQVVSVANLGQIIFASLMGFLFFGEIPPPAFYLTALLNCGRRAADALGCVCQASTAAHCSGIKWLGYQPSLCKRCHRSRSLSSSGSRKWGSSSGMVSSFCFFHKSRAKAAASTFTPCR